MEVSWTACRAKPSTGARRAARLFEWIENNLKIRLKQPIDVMESGRRRRRSLVKFRFNSVQMILCEYVAERWAQGLAIKVMIPKARQMGLSTYWQAIMFALCVIDPAKHAVVVSHDEASVDKIFAKSRTFEKHLPAHWKLDLDNRQGGKFVWAQGSSFWVASIKVGDALEKGGTLNYIHFSEVANFADRGINPDEPITSAMNAVADGPDTIVVYESTAKGRDPCFWAKCEDAKDPNSKSEYTLVFLPWYLETEYAMGWQHYRQRLMSAGRKDPGDKFRASEDELMLRTRLRDRTIGAHEKWYRYPVRLSDEQLIWRRWCLQNRCEGKQHLFSRYYPSTYDEAFSSTVTCMFDNETIDYYMGRSEKASTIGNLTPMGSSVVFDRNARGFLRVWRRPAPGEKYFVGADIGGNRKNSDPCAAYVVDGNLNVVAAFHGHMEFDRYATYLYKIGQWFNWALLVVENNHNPAVATTLHKESYPNLYYYVDNGALKGSPNRPGFNTNRKTRPELISYIEKVTRDRRLMCPDVGFAREMEHFVWNEREERYRAMGLNNDDRIMAMALAVFCAPREAAFDPQDPAARIPRAARLWNRIQGMLRDRGPSRSSQGVMF